MKRSSSSRRRRRRPSEPRQRLGEPVGSTSQAALWRFLRWVSAIALGLSVFLLWNAWGSSPLPGCGPDSGCGSVLRSRWAYLFGVPVSLPAVFAYLTLLAGTAAGTRAVTPAARRRVWWLMQALGAAVLGAALWFIGLQLFAIQAICPFCMAVHGCGLAVGIMTIGLRRRAQQERVSAPAGSRWPLRILGWAREPVPLGLAGVVLLASLQILHHPPEYEVRALDANPARSTTPPTRSRAAAPDRGGKLPADGAKVSSSRRMLRLYGGEFGLNLQVFPLLGSLDAASVMVCLFDYTCDHCRQLHPLLVDAVRDFSNRLAVAFVPVPLDPACNPGVKEPQPEHRLACDYARIGLTVWRADRTQGQVFDDWVFSQRRVPPLEEVREEAVRLVGADAFTNAWSHPMIGQQLKWGTKLYQTNYVRHGFGALPQLILGTNLVFGVLRTEEQLHRLLSAGGVLESPASSAAEVEDPQKD